VGLILVTEVAVKSVVSATQIPITLVL